MFYFLPKGHQKSRDEDGTLSPAKHLAGLESETL